MNKLFFANFNLLIKYFIKLLTIIPQTLTHLVEQKTISKIQYIFYTYLFLNFLRCNTFSILYNNKKYLKVYLNYDVVLNLIMQLNVFDKVSSILVSFLLIYLIYLDSLCYGRQTKAALIVWKYAYDLIVKSKVNFIKLNFTTENARYKLNQIVKTRKAVLHYQNFFLNTFSLQTRVEIILLSYLFDLALAIGVQLTGKFLF